MSNDINVVITGEEDVGKTFAKVQGDAKQTERVIVDSTGSSSDAFDTASRRSGAFGQAMDKASGAGTALGQGMGDLAGGIQSVSDLQTLSARRADEQKRAYVALEQSTADAEQADIDLAQAMADTDQAAVDLRQSTNDLRQAQIDGKQATLDAAQSEIDKQQAIADAETAQKEYNDAVEEHGARSDEARQASIDLKQAQQDLAQANLDAEQATADVEQAEIDATQAATDNKQASIDQKQAKADQTQATIDAKNAQLDYNEAQRNINSMSGPLGEFTSYMTALSPVILGVVGAIDLMKVAQAALTAETVTSTAAQVASKVAIAASAVATGIATAATVAWDIALAIATAPITLIVIAIAAVVAGIIYLATQTQFFQKTWEIVWSAVKEAASAVGNFFVDLWNKNWDMVNNKFNQGKTFIMGVFNAVGNFAIGAANTILGIPDQIRNVFARIADYITAPFRAGFNNVAWAWNNTIGRLSWTVPSWVPGIGGNNISAPRLPQLAVGGDIARTGAAVVHQGERVLTAQQTAMMNALVTALERGASGPAITSSSGTVQIELKPSPDFDSKMLRLLLSLIGVEVRQTGGSFDELINTTQ